MSLPDDVSVVVPLPPLIVPLVPRVVVSSAFSVDVAELDSLVVRVEVAVRLEDPYDEAMLVLSLMVDTSLSVSVLVPVSVSVFQPDWNMVSLV